MNNLEGSNIEEHVSTLSFERTVERLIATVASGGMTLFATIDHAANAQTVGMTMPPSTVLIYGNPKGGTPLMLDSPLAALDLPLRVLVRERSDGRVVMNFRPVAALLQRHGVPETLAARLEPAQRLLVAAVAP